jgi:hypothetical protein
MLANSSDAPIDLRIRVLGVVIPRAAPEGRLLIQQRPPCAHRYKFDEIERGLAASAWPNGGSNDASLVMPAIQPLPRR